MGSWVDAPATGPALMAAVLGGLLVIALLWASWGSSNDEASGFLNPTLRDPAFASSITGKRDGKMPRSMSFHSAVCAEGAFPDWANMGPPIINAAIILDVAPSKEALLETVNQLFHYERFRSRKVKVKGDWAWEELDEHSAEKHLIIENFSGREEDLYKRLELWALKGLQVPEGSAEFEFVLVRNSGSGPSAVIARVNHAVGDGISLAKLIPVIFRDLEGKSLPPPERYTRKEPNFRPSFKNPFKILSCLVKVIATPSSAYDTDVGLLETERKTFKFSGQRTLVRLPNMPLPYIKDLKNAAGVTVNDVIYSATAGAFHRYGAEIGCAALLDPESGTKVHTRALMPVALPRQITDPARALRNKWSFASAPIPVGIKDPLERLKYTHASLQMFKDSPIVVVQNIFESIVGKLLPWKLSKQIAHDTFSRHTLVFSNVPGPDYPVTFAGVKVTALFQIFANLLPQVGALSLNGQIHMAIMVDEQVVANPNRLADHFLADLADLAAQLEVQVPSAMQPPAASKPPRA